MFQLQGITSEDIYPRPSCIFQWHYTYVIILPTLMSSVQIKYLPYLHHERKVSQNKVKAPNKQCKCIIPRYTHFIIIWCQIYLLMCATYQELIPGIALAWKFQQFSRNQSTIVSIFIWMGQYSQCKTGLSLVSIPTILSEYCI